MTELLLVTLVATLVQHPPASLDVAAWFWVGLLSGFALGYIAGGFTTNPTGDDDD